MENSNDKEINGKYIQKVLGRDSRTLYLASIAPKPRSSNSNWTLDCKTAKPPSKFGVKMISTLSTSNFPIVEAWVTDWRGSMRGERDRIAWRAKMDLEIKKKKKSKMLLEDSGICL